MNTDWQEGCRRVLQSVLEERIEQEIRYGHVNDDLIDGTGPDVRWLPYVGRMEAFQIQEDLRVDYERWQAVNGLPTWMHLVREEIAEAFQETDPERLQGELIQVAALCVSWVERIRARKVGSTWD